MKCDWKLNNSNSKIIYVYQQNMYILTSTVEFIVFNIKVSCSKKKYNVIKPISKSAILDNIEL